MNKEPIPFHVSIAVGEHRIARSYYITREGIRSDLPLVSKVVEEIFRQAQEFVIPMLEACAREEGEVSPPYTQEEIEETEEFRREVKALIEGQREDTL